MRHRSRCTTRLVAHKVVLSQALDSILTLLDLEVLTQALAHKVATRAATALKTCPTKRYNTFHLHIIEPHDTLHAMGLMFLK